MNITYTNQLDQLQQPQRRAIIRSIRSKIVFGTPGNGCQGVGICRVMTGSATQEDCKCPAVPALISKSKAGLVRMKFAKASMEPRFIKRHFGWRLFQVLEPYEIPALLARKLGLGDRQRSIEPGIYAVWETRDWLIVDFKINW